MSLLISSSLVSTPTDNALRVGDFSLLPQKQALPIISSQPSKNVSQRTWVRAMFDGNTIYQKINPLDGVFKCLPGTEVLWNIVAVDPADTNQPTTDKGLSFFWRKDGSPIVELNNSNLYKGSRGIVIQSQSCTPLASGRYVCEVSNQFGTVESQPLDLLVVEPKKYPRLFTNLLVNGNADSQLDGWTTDTDIISANFSDGIFTDYNFGSMPASTVWWDFENDRPSSFYQSFRFSQSGYGQTLFPLLHPWISQSGADWINQTGDWMVNLNQDSGNSLLPTWNQWMLFANQPQIVGNEDGSILGQYAFNGFFPGMAWIDLYNQNNNDSCIGLLKESENQVLSYFTRDKLKFTKYGGKINSQMSQTVDLTSLADFIDGNVFGVKYATSQFFAYVGAGISRYQLQVETTTGEQTLNWNIVDSEDFFKRLSQNNSAIKKALVPNTTINIVPLVEDKTEIELRYFDQAGNLITTDIVVGPNELDVFAVKEKVFLPISLYPLFEFLVVNNNPIKIFGQTYTTTDALQDLFEETTPFPQTISSDNLEGDFSAQVEVDDRNASFLLEKFGFQKFSGLYPQYTSTNRAKRSLKEYGAAAMFAVEKTRVIPKGARSVQVVVRFSHTSEVILDNDPRIKGWNSEYIYFENFGQNKGNSLRPAEYGYPRCGITKMKYLVVPNNFKIEDDYVSYKLPPSANTIVGIEKQRLSLDVHNTSTPGDFSITRQLPTNPLPFVPSLDPFTSSSQASDLDIVLATGASYQEGRLTTVELDNLQLSSSLVEQSRNG